MCNILFCHRRMCVCNPPPSTASGFDFNPPLSAASAFVFCCPSPASVRRTFRQCVFICNCIKKGDLRQYKSVTLLSPPANMTFFHFFSFLFVLFFSSLSQSHPQDASNITGSRSFDSQNRAEGHCENDGDWCVFCEVQAAERQLGTIYVIGELGQRQPSPRYRCSLLKRGDGSAT
jgi:hypothetical protein